MTKFWLYIDSYVYLTVKKNSALLYNSLNGEIIEVTSPMVIEIIRKLHLRKNHQVILLTEDALKSPDIKSFIDNIRINFMGDLLQTTLSSSKPIQLIPYMKIHQDTKYLQKEYNSIGDGIKSYLHELTIYFDINNCKVNCNICKSAYKQFLCCTSQVKNESIDIEKISNFLHLFKNQFLSINLIGNNFNFSELLDRFYIQKDYNFIFKWITHILNVRDTIDSYKRIKDFSLDLIITDIPDNFYLEEVKLIQNSKIKAHYNFIIQNEDDYQKAEGFITVNKIDSFDFQPFYNETNLEFFKNNVFINREDIIENKSPYKEILINETINKFFFGKLIILNDGNIYSSINSKSIGHIEDNIKLVLLSEFKHNISWLKLRKHYAPCKSCNYSSLCPPLSNLEQVLGKNNLCNIYE